jgi:predicted transcriptional regulator of viral defense system
MSRQQHILELARTKGIIRAEDVEAVGISRNYLYRMHKKGLLEKSAVGLYTLPEAPVTENSSLAEVAKRLPHAVVCLITALSYHGITTQIPHEIWMTIPRGSWRPDIKYPPQTRIRRGSGG